MIRQPNTPAQHYEAIAATLLSDPVGMDSRGVTESKGQFGSTALKTNGKIFAMLARDQLVLKLPRHRVDALIDAGHGARFDPGHGRLMKEWIAVEPSANDDWLSLAREAMAFVASGHGGGAT